MGTGGVAASVHHQQQQQQHRHRSGAANLLDYTRLFDRK